MGHNQRILSSIALNKINHPGLHHVGGVPNLALLISKSGSRSWILRYSINGKRRDMGLGKYPEVSLSEARKIALDKRHLLRNGIDPIIQRQENLDRIRLESKKTIIFRDAAEQYIAIHRSGWKSSKHEAQWRSTLKNHAYPTIGNKVVRHIDNQQILKVLEPIWSETTETASRIRHRIENILDWCKIQGYRDGDNPASWNGNLKALLPSPKKIKKVRRHPALAWKKCPDFFSNLSCREGISINALQLCILTACRSNEIRGARWSEFDLENTIWIIPASRMKAGVEHRIPLSSQVMKLLRNTPRFEGQDLLFPNSQGKPLSDMALLQAVRQVDSVVTVHGFRSTFRDWAGEATYHPKEVAEYALAHRLEDQTEAAYARGDLFDKRRFLMNDWADFVTKSRRKCQDEQGILSPPRISKPQHDTTI